MRYPKLSAAIDEALAKFVAKNGEGLVEVLIESLMAEPVVAEKVAGAGVAEHEEVLKHAD